MQIELGEGKFAIVKEVDELRSGDRRAVNSVTRVGIDPETNQGYVPGDQSDEMKYALCVRIITDWNLEWPLPSRRPDSLDKLTLKQQDLLFEGVQPHFDAINESDKNATLVEGSDPTSDSAS